jgi:hypothetical protein
MGIEQHIVDKPSRKLRCMRFITHFALSASLVLAP